MEGGEAPRFSPAAPAARISAGAMPAKPSARWARRLAATLALLLLAVAAATGHALLWGWLCGRLEAGFAAWADSHRAEGWQVVHGTLVRGGWPFAAALTVPGFSLRGGAGFLPGSEVDWRAEALVLRIAPPSLDRLAVEAPGRHRLRLGGVALSFTADSLSVALPIGNGTAPPRQEASAAAQGLRFDTPAGAVEVRAASLDYGAPPAGGGGAIALRVSAADATLPPDLPGTARLGPVVERVGLDLLLSGPVPPDDSDPARAAAAWRDAGGALVIQALDARWGEVAASATATLTLDAALQPAGTGVLRLAGGEALLDAAGDAGLLPPFGAAAARVALRALGRAPPEGGPAVAEMPLVLRDRSLRLGGVPLARLPVLTWSAQPMPASGADRPRFGN
jgi:hypothetical protein